MITILKEPKAFRATRLRGYSWRASDLRSSFRDTVAGNNACTNGVTCGRVNSHASSIQIASQATSGLRPTYNTNVIGTHGAITGNGTTKFLALDTPLAWTGDFILGVVFKVIDATKYVPIVGSGADGSGIYLDPAGQWTLLDEDFNELDLANSGFAAPNGTSVVAVIQRVSGIVTVKQNGYTASGSGTDVGLATINAVDFLHAQTVAGEKFSLQSHADFAAGSGTVRANEFSDLYNLLKADYGL